MPEKAQVKDVVKSHFRSDEAVQMWESVYRDSEDFFSYAMSARRATVIDVLRAERVEDGPTVADVGCGSGLVGKDLMALGYDVTGVDISEGMLENARRIPGLKLQIGDVEHLPFPDSSFDKIICLGVISYVPDERRALAELHRVLKPGGRLVLAVRNKLESAILLDPIGLLVKAWRKLFRRKTRGSPGGAPAYYHRNFIPWTLRRNVSDAGFEINRCIGRGFDFPGINGKRITPLRSAIRFSRRIEALSDDSMTFLRNWGMVYIIVATKTPKI